MPLSFGSLFAGIGGFDLGFERAGMVCKWQVEIDDYANRVLAKHWPGVRRWRDVRDFPPSSSEDWSVDVICGGFPCKQTSTGAAVHGRRNGLDGKDSGLWWEMLRIIDCLRPGIAIVENVAGATTWVETIKGGLARYKVGELRVSASEFGALHERRRMFIVADIDRERFSRAWESGACEVASIERRAVAGDAWDVDSGEFSRMAHGLPCRLDRRKRVERLGNAVVPQVAQWIGERIVAADLAK